MMSTSEDCLLVSKADGVLRLTLNRPDRRNALNDTLIGRLTGAFTDVSQDRDVRAIVLAATGDRAFCSGADLNPTADTFGFDYSEPKSNYANMLRAGRATTVPVIGRINGYCLAGGMGLLAVCDMACRLVDEAKFGLPEVKVGLFPMQVAALLQSMIPPRRFAEMCFTGEMIDADTALAYGLVNAVVPHRDLDEKVGELVERITGNSPAAIRRGKHALTATAGMTPTQALDFMEAQVGVMPLTEDAREGMAAFAEKRAPQWTGQ